MAHRTASRTGKSPAGEEEGSQTARGEGAFGGNGGKQVTHLGIPKDQERHRARKAGELKRHLPRARISEPDRYGSKGRP